MRRPADGREPTTYWDYLALEPLLGLQGGLDGSEGDLSNDEVLFIIVHQIDELWLKLVLRELVVARDCFAQEPVPEMALAQAVRGLRRISLLFRQLGQHFDLIETMTTRDYLGFREKLSPASGFQSAQLREIEILLGLESRLRVPFGHEDSYLNALKNPDGSDSWASRRVASRIEDRPTLREAVERWLWRTPIQGSVPGDADDDTVVEAFIEAYLTAHANEGERAFAYANHDALSATDSAKLAERFEHSHHGARYWLQAEDVEGPDERAFTRRVRAALLFIESYRDLPLLAWPREVVEAIIEFEQASLVFRQRHARMVERIIGRRTGTGGSSGVEYLDETALRYRVFDDVWVARGTLIRETALPPLAREEYYRLVAERPES